jgi:hypothetical protein
MLPHISNFSKDYYRDSELSYLTDAIDACVFAEMENRKLKQVRNQTIEVELINADIKRVKGLFFWTSNKQKISRMVHRLEDKLRERIQHKITGGLRKRRNPAEYLRKLIISEVERGRKCQGMAIIEQVKNREYNESFATSANPFKRFLARAFGPRSRYPKNYAGFVVGGAAIAGASAIAYGKFRDSEGGFLKGLADDLFSCLLYTSDAADDM